MFLTDSGEFSMSKRILFISHDASRTGAPILLLHFLKALHKRNTDFIIEVIIGMNGPLVKEFTAIGRTLILHSPQEAVQQNKIFKLFSRIKNKFLPPPNRQSLLKEKLSRFLVEHYDLVFSNTITNGFILQALPPINGKVITYVHELENSIKTFTNPEALAFNLERSDYFLYPSRAVKNNLEAVHKIGNEKLFHLPYYIPEINVSDELKVNKKKELRCEGKIMIGAIGTSDWRKGIDLFIQLALLTRKRLPEKSMKFIWIGASLNGQTYNQLAYEIQQAGLAGYVEVLGSVSNPLDYLACLDIFILTSREDPYPLVVLEAGMLEKPIICFEKSGGAPEFLAEGRGLVVPFLDLESMANGVSELIRRKDIREKYGKSAYEKYEALHSENSAVTLLEGYFEKFIK